MRIELGIEKVLSLVAYPSGVELQGSSLMMLSRRIAGVGSAPAKQLFFVLVIALLTGSDGLLMYGSSFHVTPQGTAQGNGSYTSPWDLQTALNQPSTVHPGDTIWVHSGVYHGAFTSWLQGSQTSPIVVRGFQQDHVAIEGGINPPEGIVFLLGRTCQHTWFWGLEFRGTPATRADQSFGSGICTAQIGQNLPGLKIINCVIHDFVNGFGFWKEAVGGEIYGNIIYNNGFDASDRGHGHGIYVMNQTDRKRIADNILFNGFANGIQAYGSETQYADNMTLSGNVIFNSGVSSQVGGGWNLIVGTMGTRMAVGDSVVGNYVFRSPNSGNFGGTNIGWEAGQQSAAVIDNWFVGSSSRETALQLVNCSNLQLRNNRIIGTLAGFSSSSYPDNIYAASAPASGDTSIVRVNGYDPSRANVVVFNWSGRDSVRLTPAGFAYAGDSVDLYNAQNIYGDQRFTTKVSADGSIAIPMMTTRWTVSQAIAGVTPHTTFPQFGAFVLVLRHPSALHPPTPISPNPNSGHLMGSVTFQWSPEVAQVFETQLSKDSIFAQTEFDTLTVGSSFKFDSITTPGVYYWRVRVIDGQTAGPFSPALSFYAGPSSSGVDASGPIAESFRLFQNYPNPFNPSTTIEYSVATTSHVTLSIVNTVGTVVARLVNGVVSGGHHIVTWNGSGIASGVYLCLLQSANAMQVRRMVLLK